MIVEQHYLQCLSQASYLIADEESRTAVVIDPRRDVEIYLERASELGVTIEHVLLTHLHADFVAGHLELAQACGAVIHLSGDAKAEYAHNGLADGDVLTLGDVRIEALATPGHTPESMCYVLFDTSASSTEPHAVFSGDTLFIGDVGRPDLMASVGFSADELARSLFTSLQTKLMPLPDATILYPGHGAGSACGKNLSTALQCTIGQQRQTNYALQFGDVDEFVAAVTANQSAAPAYFAFDAVMNRSERGTLDAALEEGLQALDLDAVLAAQADGARLLDVRDTESFAAGHLRGSMNLPLDGRFASWAGTLCFESERIVLVTEPGHEHPAALRLGRVGLDRVVGFLDGGAAAWSAREDVASTAMRVDAADVAQRLQTDARLQVIDLRFPGEWSAGHIDGALHFPLGSLAARVDELPRDKTLVLVCATSYRSSIAASILRTHGFDRIEDLRGGMRSWEALDLPCRVPV